jgi:hypothetical protein
MKAREMKRKLLGGALGVVADVARHVAWYLSYKIDGRPRPRV